MWITAVIPFIFLTSLITTFQQVQPASATLPDGSFVVRVYYENIAQIDQLASYDLWEYNNLTEKYVLVAVSHSEYAKLVSEGWHVEIDQPTSHQLNQIISTANFFNGYRTTEEIYADLATLNNAYPSLSEIVVYGESYCKQENGCTTPGGDFLAGYDLQAIRISNENITGTSTISNSNIISGTKPIFFLMATIHAREITTSELAMRMAEWLLEGYGNDADATWLVDWHEIWIVPIANPDGHWLVELGMEYGSSPLYHRKNSNRSHGCTTWPSYSFNHFGVDLNRNHSFEWGGTSTSNNPCDPLFRGPHAASEPETIYLENLVTSLIPDQRGPNIGDAAPDDTTGLFITMHSYSELVLWPWAHTSNDAPNHTGLKAIGDKLAAINGYTSCNPADCLYAASGTSDDWAYGELGIPAFTFEVGKVFMPPYSDIDAEQWPDNGPALQYAAKLARNPYQLIQGPEVVEVNTATSTMLSAGISTSHITVTAVFSHNNPIATATYALNTPFWATDTITHAITPIDGSFDTGLETGTAVFDLSTLPAGRHLLYLRGQDDKGNWGVVTAVYLTNFPNKKYLPLISK